MVWELQDSNLIFLEVSNQLTFDETFEIQLKLEIQTSYAIIYSYFDQRKTET